MLILQIITVVLQATLIVLFIVNMSASQKQTNKLLVQLNAIQLNSTDTIPTLKKLDESCKKHMKHIEDIATLLSITTVHQIQVELAESVDRN